MTANGSVHFVAMCVAQCQDQNRMLYEIEPTASYSSGKSPHMKRTFPRRIAIAAVTTIAAVVVAVPAQAAPAKAVTADSSPWWCRITCLNSCSSC